MSEKEFILQFISLYRNYPQLWKLGSKYYTDKNKRSEAIREMINVLRLSRPSITELEIKKKINILRTSFKRESNKIKKSRLYASSPEDVYVPSLWYFKELEFLEDQVEEEMTHNTIHDMESLAVPTMSAHLQAIISPSAKKKRISENPQDELLLMAVENFKNTSKETESQVMVKNWVFKLERMAKDQRRLAEKFINDILFEGECGTLHRNSVMINVNQFPSWSCSSSPNPHSTSVRDCPSPVQQVHSEVSLSLQDEKPQLITEQMADSLLSSSSEELRDNRDPTSC